MNVKEQLRKAEVPHRLLQPAMNRTLPAGLVDIFGRGIDVLATSGDTYQVMLILGTENPNKDVFCACLLAWCMQHYNKNGEWIPPPSDRLPENIGRRGITVLPSIDLYTALHARQISCVLRNRISYGRRFIIGASTKKDLYKVLGDSTAKYVLSTATVFNLPDDEPEGMEI